MNCPVCDDVKMREVDKEGVLVDICPQCKGVWLDRGELEKLMQGVREVRKQYDEWQSQYDHQQHNHQQYNNQQHNHQHNNHHDKKHYDTHHSSYGHDHKGNYYGKHKKKKTVFDVFESFFD